MENYAMKRAWLLISILVGAVYGDTSDFSIIFLGDIHFDRIEHHDFSWLESNRSDDVIRQVKNYCKITNENLPLLINTIRSVYEQAIPPVSYFMQIGDFTEGLCGNYSLAKKQLKEFTSYIDSASLGAPFCVVQGNHDITGPGSEEAYIEIIYPWIEKQIGFTPVNGCYSLPQGNVLFLFYNCYDDKSLDWLEKTINQSNQKEFVVLCHEPVVPFQARSNWIQFASESEAIKRGDVQENKDKRIRLLNILGQARATVLCGHLHDFGVVARKTEKGTFVQLTFNAVLSNTDNTIRNHIRGIEHYNASLTDLEPSFSPETLKERKMILEAEKPFISYYEFADTFGFVRLVFSNDDVVAEVYVGTDTREWRSINLSELKR